VKTGAVMRSNNKLLIKQLDKKLQIFSSIQDIEPPKGGWISLVRNTLNMSLRQLGERSSKTAQGVQKIEKNEADGTITLKSLRDMGDALNMKFVYGFIPKDGSLEQMIEKRAIELARKIVMRTSTSMKLEDQQNSTERLKEATKEMADELKKEMPKILWD
jgi:predicted DNA-binding mobile mystery protein A